MSKSTENCKRKYRIEASEWVYGERKPRRQWYEWAYSKRQAIALVLMKNSIPDQWILEAEAI